MSDEKPEEQVVTGTVLATICAEIMSAMRELDARRKFDEQVGQFLKERKLSAKFEAWRAKQG